MVSCLSSCLVYMYLRNRTQRWQHCVSSQHFFQGVGADFFTSIKFRSQGITRLDGNWITWAFPKCGLWGSGDDFPFLTCCKIWVLINLTFGFIVCRGHIRMRMKPASWEKRGHYRVVSRSIGPSSQGCTRNCRSWVWWEPYRWHTTASVHLFTPGIQISPLTFAWLCWILEPGFLCHSAFLHRIPGTLGCGLASPHRAW